MNQKDITVCIVDDDESVRKALKRLIKSARYRIKSFGSAEEFIGSRYYKNAALLILDVRMPTMSGLELQNHLKDSDSDLPIIFISAFDSNDCEQQARDAGAIDFFQKPVDAPALLDTIQKILDSSSLSREKIKL